MTRIGDRVPKPPLGDENDRVAARAKAVQKRPRVISVNAVENLLPYDGCICCGAMLSDERSLKHRAGCMYLAFTRERVEAERWHARVLQVEQALREVRNISNQAVSRERRER